MGRIPGPQQRDVAGGARPGCRVVVEVAFPSGDS